MAKQTFSVGQVLTAAQMTSLQQTAMLGGAASAKTTSYTLVAADAGTAISMTSTSATTITVNTGLFADGDTVQITNLGSGVCTITAGTATVNTASSLALAQWESGTLDFRSASAAVFIKGAGAAAGGGGKVLQVVQATYSTETDNSTTTYSDTGLTASITPSASTSKILAMVTMPCRATAENNANGVQLNLVRASTQVYQTIQNFVNGFMASLPSGFQANISYNYLDSPSTTSATTYKVQFRNNTAAARARICESSFVATIILMEIGA